MKKIYEEENIIFFLFLRSNIKNEKSTYLLLYSKNKSEPSFDKINSTEYRRNFQQENHRPKAVILLLFQLKYRVFEINHHHHIPCIDRYFENRSISLIIHSGVRESDLISNSQLHVLIHLCRSYLVLTHVHLHRKRHREIRNSIFSSRNFRHYYI